MARLRGSGKVKQVRHMKKRFLLPLPGDVGRQDARDQPMELDANERPQDALEDGQQGDRAPEKEDLLDQIVAHLRTIRAGQRQSLVIQPHRTFVVGRHFQWYVGADRPAKKPDGRRLMNAAHTHSDYVVPAPSVSARTIVGDYRILPRVLGTGSFATVRLAIQIDTGAQAACKQQDRRWIEEEENAATARREIQLLQRLSHPNINGLLALEKDRRYQYCFVSCATGGDLFGYILAHGQIQEAEAKFIFFQLQNALAYVHEHGVAHRDIKVGEARVPLQCDPVLSIPSQGENVLLITAGKFPHVQLADFGLASERTLENAIVGLPLGKHNARSHCGTVSYLPPEVLKARVVLEAYEATSVDVWALGLVLYVMLSGRHPFDSALLDAMDDCTYDVQLELLERGHVTEEYLVDRGLLVMKPAPPSSGDQAAQDTLVERRALIRAIFSGIDVSSPDLEGTSDAGQLVQVRVSKRLTARQAGKSAWIQSSLPQLKAMYGQRVLGRLS
ncbi:kinase-like protein [Ceraceosorus guamensis]|uniref:Kinase-like protein n=1 Tax=Ceraceosorus guamensis TaxID=1522189 RepID=A0A316W730_9BASI|nr:kinase-like protein [Ceraceosorus guamensis]PWN45649.1 kinase-like protein [Ceraceosorus guamensis]